MGEALISHEGILVAGLSLAAIDEAEVVVETEVIVQRRSFQLCVLNVASAVKYRFDQPAISQCTVVTVLVA